MRRIGLLALCLTTLVLMPSSVLADNKLVIKHRQGIMEALGGHFTAAFASMGNSEQNADDKVFHASAIAHLAKISATTFPKGSGSGKTKAMAEIWKNPEEYTRVMDKFIVRADQFAEAAKGSDFKAYAASAKALGKACKGCHDNYKEK